MKKEPLALNVGQLSLILILALGASLQAEPYELLAQQHKSAPVLDQCLSKGFKGTLPQHRDSLGKEISQRLKSTGTTKCICVTRDKSCWMYDTKTKEFKGIHFSDLFLLPEDEPVAIVFEGKATPKTASKPTTTSQRKTTALA